MWRRFRFNHYGSMIHIHVLNILKLVLKDDVFYEAELFLPHCAIPQCVKDSTAAVLRAQQTELSSRASLATYVL
jgi:hypothetical protein